jgi:hypothetical protein
VTGGAADAGQIHRKRRWSRAASPDLADSLTLADA